MRTERLPRVLLRLLFLFGGFLMMILPLSGKAATLAVATDLHYIAPELTDHGTYFTSMLDAGDGKITMVCEELADDFLNEVITLHPDALILTGDLTFNGALQSHEALAEKLRTVEAAGIPVLVLPGNHDVYNSNAASFSGDSFTRVQSATSADFRRIYAEFGYDEAVACDTDSLSYVYELPDGTRILLMDTNTEQNPCGISESTLAWVREQSAGGFTLAAGHQNLYQHSMCRTGYVIEGAEKLAQILRDANVSLFLSGHMHIQHLCTVDGLTEIATSSLSVYPCQYAIVTTGPMTYSTRRMEQYTDYAADFMDKKTASQLSGLSSEAIAYACEANRCYFSGRMDTFPSGTAPSIGGFFDAYIASMQADVGQNFTVWAE